MTISEARESDGKGYGIGPKNRGYEKQCDEKGKRNTLLPLPSLLYTRIDGRAARSTQQVERVG